MRKCAQCGKDIPSGNTSCNYCGYNPNDINKHYSFGKTPNMNKIPINANKGGKLIITISDNVNIWFIVCFWRI